MKNYPNSINGKGHPVFLRWYFWLMLLASVSLTIGAWYTSKTSNDERQQDLFYDETSRLITLVQERMEHYEMALWSGVSNFHSHNFKVDSLGWKKFANTLSIDKRLPGINGIGFIKKVSKKGLPGFIQEQQVFRPDFNLHPKLDRETYWPIVFIEPEERNHKALGLDMGHETNRFDGVLRAMNTGQGQITGPILLVQDEKQTPGFLFFTPLYRSEANEVSHIDKVKLFEGLVYAPFTVEKLMQGTLSNKNRLINFRIEDKGALLYDELNSSSES